MKHFLGMTAILFNLNFAQLARDMNGGTKNDPGARTGSRNCKFIPRAAISPRSIKPASKRYDRYPEQASDVNTSTRQFPSWSSWPIGCDD